jgi:hypothetical protein
MMMKYLAILALSFGLAVPVMADEITNRDQLMAYLKEAMPDGQQVSYTYNIAQKFTAHQNHGTCFSFRTLGQLSSVTKILVLNKLIGIKVTKERGGYNPYGGGAACEYEITAFNATALKRRGVKLDYKDGFVQRIVVPLVEQRLLGVTDVDTNGYVSISETKCDVSFRPWFENSNPSLFARFYKSDFLKDGTLKNVFSSNYKTSTWCLQRHYDNSFKWALWSRL